MTRHRIQMRVDDTKPLLREDRHMSHRIQLRGCTLYFKDGLAGTGAVNEPTNAPVADADSFAIGSVALNTVDTDLVPIMVQNSLIDTEWDTVNGDDPSTWTNWEDDLKNAGLSVIERKHVLGLVMQVNSLDEQKIQAAREVFLRGTPTQSAQ